MFFANLCTFIEKRKNTGRVGRRLRRVSKAVPVGLYDGFFSVHAQIVEAEKGHFDAKEELFFVCRQEGKGNLVDLRR